MFTMTTQALFFSNDNFQLFNCDVFEMIHCCGQICLAVIMSFCNSNYIWQTNTMFYHLVSSLCILPSHYSFFLGRLYSSNIIIPLQYIRCTVESKPTVPQQDQFYSLGFPKSICTRLWLSTLSVYNIQNPIHLQSASLFPAYPLWMSVTRMSNFISIFFCLQTVD